MAKKAVEMIEPVEEEEPIYFAPKRVSVVSDIANVLSWIVLVGFVGDVVAQIMSLQSQITTNAYVISDLLKEVSFYSYFFSSILEPLLIGLALFGILQGVSVGLDMLLELIYKAHDAESEGKV